MNTPINIRIAEIEDIDSIETLMKRSMRVLGEGHYSEKQVDACCQFVCVPDRQLIEDKTFFVAFDEGKMVGCGGWSFRNTLYAGPKAVMGISSKLNPATDRARIRAMFIDPLYSGKGIGSLILECSERAAKGYGFSKAELGATLSGLAFYKRKGWHPMEEESATLPDGTTIGVVRMEKNL